LVNHEPESIIDVSQGKIRLNKQIIDESLLLHREMCAVDCQTKRGLAVADCHEMAIEVYVRHENIDRLSQDRHRQMLLKKLPSSVNI
jgi:hypothetical protein